MAFKDFRLLPSEDIVMMLHGQNIGVYGRSRYRVAVSDRFYTAANQSGISAIDIFNLASRISKCAQHSPRVRRRLSKRSAKLGSCRGENGLHT